MYLDRLTSDNNEVETIVGLWDDSHGEDIEEQCV
jgi:hypothetical protein